jgi:hypothetical protein
MVVYSSENVVNMDHAIGHVTVCYMQNALWTSEVALWFCDETKVWLNLFCHCRLIL